MTLIAVDDVVLVRAEQLDPLALRTLDAIHVATALSLEPLEGLVTYDARLAQAADAAGLAVFAPGT